MTRSTLSRLTQLSTCALATVILGGCVQRKLTITSDPPGAVVTLNDREAGRTPFTTDFLWYGDYDVQVRKDGFETINKSQPLPAPWWQVPPIDFFAEFMPWHPTDRRSLNYVLSPITPDDTDKNDLISRANILQLQLEDSRVPSTKPAATQPATVPATRASSTAP